jgi:hypothetical protein
MEKLSDAKIKAAEAKLRGKTVRGAIENLEAKEKAGIKGVAIANAFKTASKKKRYRFDKATKTWK